MAVNGQSTAALTRSRLTGQSTQMSIHVFKLGIEEEKPSPQHPKLHSGTQQLSLARSRRPHDCTLAPPILKCIVAFHPRQRPLCDYRDLPTSNRRRNEIINSGGACRDLVSHRHHVMSSTARGTTHPHPWGVVTPKKQSSSALGTTCSGRIGTVTTPALTSEMHSDSAAAASAAGFMVVTD